MPIVTKDFTFTQNQERAFVDVPLKGIHPSKIDIYSNDLYVKINFPPYFFELDLKYPIDSDASTAHVGNGIVKFELVKREPAIWDQVRFESNDPQEIRQRRADAEKDVHERIQKQKEERRAKKAAEDREAVRYQIQVEREKRERIEALKAAEKHEAEKSIKAWAEQALRLEKNVVSSTPVQESQDLETTSSFMGEKDKRVDSAIFGEDDPIPNASNKNTDDLDALLENVEEVSDDEDIDMEAIRARVKAQLKVREQPPPRNSSQITLTFTSRGLIPTKTARETEDARWRFRIKLAEEYHAQKKKDPSGKAEESNAAFLKDKGIDFFKQKNYQACLYALSDALDIQKDDLECLAYRAECHLNLKDGQACVRDCTTGLSVLIKIENELRDSSVPEATEANQQRQLFRSKFLFLQGSARIRFLGEPERGAALLDEAVKCDPFNIELQEQAEAVKLKGPDIGPSPSVNLDPNIV